MRKILRFIGTSPSNGELNEETITFTEDFDSPADEWCVPGHTVYCDQLIEMEIPACFPMETTFRKE